MKSKKILLGMLVIVLAFGMTVVGCGGEDDDKGGGGGDSFTGTWVAKDPEDGLDAMKIVAANGSFKGYGFEYEQAAGSTSQPKVTTIEVYRGTYTTSGNTVTVTFTQINTGYLSWDGEGSRPADKWTNYADVPDDLDDIPPQGVQGTISGNSVNFAGMILTKQ
jgi:hypothetical protein